MYGHEKGSYLWDGLITRTSKNADNACWEFFWEQIPKKYQKMYDRGYEKRDFREALIKYSFYLIFIAYILIPFNTFLEICYFSLLKEIMKEIRPYIFTIWLCLTMAIIDGWHKTVIRKIYKKYLVRSKEEKFVLQVDEAYKKFYDRYHSEVGAQFLLNDLRSTVAPALALVAAAAGLLGPAIATTKVIKGEELTPLNVASAVTGIDGLSEASDTLAATDASLQDNIDIGIDNTIDVDMEPPPEEVTKEINSVTGIDKILEQYSPHQVNIFSANDGINSIPENMNAQNTASIVSNNDIDQARIVQIDTDTTVIQDDMSQTMATAYTNPLTKNMVIQGTDGLRIGSITSDGVIQGIDNLTDGHIVIMPNGDQIIQNTNGMTIGKILANGVMVDAQNMPIGSIKKV